MTNAILTGLGIAFGLAFWPVLVPIVLILAIVELCTKGRPTTPREQRETPNPSGSAPMAAANDQPVIPNLLEIARERTAALNEQMQREHLERSLKK